MKSKFSKILKSICYISLITIIIPVLAFSNGAQPIESPIDQSIIFNEDSGIALTEETIIYKFEEIEYRGRVEVEYNLKNMTDEEKSFDILFVTPNLGGADFKVKVNDVDVENIQIKQPLQRPDNWNFRIKDKIVEPFSKKPFKRSLSGYSEFTRDSISGAQFPVTIKENDSIKLKISYNSESGFYRYSEVINTVYSQIYYLTPAKFWEGDTKVNLRIELPKDSNKMLFSNMPIKKINDYIYEGKLDKIPDEEWLFSFADKKGLIFNTNLRVKHNTYIITIVSVLFIISIVLKITVKKRYSKYIRYVIYLLILISILNIKPSYGFMVMLAILVIYNPLFYLILIIIAVLIISKKNKSKEEIK